jgi:hypothetical protein
VKYPSVAAFRDCGSAVVLTQGPGRTLPEIRRTRLNADPFGAEVRVCRDGARLYMDPFDGLHPRLDQGGTGYAVRGKQCRRGRKQDLHTGWLVGWVERGGAVYPFATQIGSSNLDVPMRVARQGVTRGALHELGVLP